VVGVGVKAKKRVRFSIGDGDGYKDSEPAFAYVAEPEYDENGN
jgi:hypothetical protein